MSFSSTIKLVNWENKMINNTNLKGGFLAAGICPFNPSSCRQNTNRNGEEKRTI